LSMGEGATEGDVMGTAEDIRDRVKCRHCSIRVGRQRGLCGKCYDNKEVRSRYPTTGSKQEMHGRKGVGFETARDLTGWEPTRALPGTPEKIAVLGERATRGFPLWHPNDATRDSMVKISLEDIIRMDEMIRLSCEVES